MADFNKVLLIGRLTRDPELRYTPNGAAVTELPVATSRSWTGKDGQPQKDTVYVDVTVWNRQAENCCQYLKKGRAVHVEGFLKMDTWDDKATGEKRSKLKVEAERVQFLDRREDGQGGGGSDDDFAAPSEPQPRRAAPASSGEARGTGNGPARGGYAAPSAPAPRRPAPPPSAEEDDDIPF
jgi:single-strand DNA-binding protein